MQARTRSYPKNHTSRAEHSGPRVFSNRLRGCCQPYCRNGKAETRDSLGRVCKFNNQAGGLFDVETITVEAPDSPAAQHCLGEYFRELATRFEGGFDPAKSIIAKPDEFAPPDGVFIVVRLGETFVGCGGFKRLNSKSAYLKRMWIAPFARGRGLGRMLLRELENKAREAGYFTACLETNRALTEAIRMYANNGYREIAPFNDEFYAHHWFEKGLRS